MTETTIPLSTLTKQLNREQTEAGFQFTTLPPLSLYIHVPWCVRKCPYCDFNSHEIRDPVPEADYLAALFADLEQELPSVWGRKIISIFIGGGTPSVLSPETVEQLLAGIRARIMVLPNAEITLEANPATVDSVRFQGFRQAGINRLSLGIQSFNPEALQTLGRVHGRDEAIAAIEAAQTAGFNNFNLDLMFGLPKQTEQQALDDLHMALSFKPPHLSWYQLTIEPNTLFHRRPPPLLPEDDDLWAIQSAGQRYLAEQGYQQYEVSAYAQARRQCQHNLNYWQFGDYLGIGAGAHGKISDAHQGSIRRSSKQRHPRRYLETATTPEINAETHYLTANDVCLEFMLNALRLHEGFSAAQFEAYTGLPLHRVSNALQQAQAQGWLNYIAAEQSYLPSEQGRLFLNEMLELFMSD